MGEEKYILLCKDAKEFKGFHSDSETSPQIKTKDTLDYFKIDDDSVIVLNDTEEDITKDYKYYQNRLPEILKIAKWTLGTDTEVFCAIHPGGTSKTELNKLLDDLNKKEHIQFSYFGSLNKSFLRKLNDLENVKDAIKGYIDANNKDYKIQEKYNKDILELIKENEQLKSLNPKIYYFDGQEIKGEEPDNCNPFGVYVLIITEALVQTGGVLQKRIAEFFGNYLKESHIPLLTIGNFNLEEIETYLPVKFLDSSIWNYYVSIKLPNEDDGKKIAECKINKKVNKVLGIVKNNHEKNLYKTVVCREFIEFNYRQLANSYIKKPKGVTGGGHSAHISPFLFHSEYNMKLEARKVLEKVNKLINKNNSNPTIKWKTLMVDDYADKTLKTITGAGESKNKEVIFCHIVGEFLKKQKDNFSFEFKDKDKGKMEFAAYLEQPEGAKAKIKNNQYDLILLDYLLDKPKGSEKRDYGDALFIDKETDTGETVFKNAKGVLGKSWVFPISSFSTAMLSKLREDGISKVDDDWYISDGADIVSTPNLFAYYFFKLIELQLNQAVVTKEEIIKDILNSGFIDEGANVRLQAKGMYGSFMHKFGVKEHLRLDKKNKSAFASSILKHLDENHKEDKEFYEQVRKLLFLVGNGTQNDVRKIYTLLEQIEMLLPEEYQMQGFTYKEIKVIYDKSKSFKKELEHILESKKQKCCNKIIEIYKEVYKVNSDECRWIDALLSESCYDIELLVKNLILDSINKCKVFMFFNSILNYVNNLKG